MFMDHGILVIIIRIFFLASNLSVQGQYLVFIDRPVVILTVDLVTLFTSESFVMFRLRVSINIILHDVPLLAKSLLACADQATILIHDVCTM